MREVKVCWSELEDRPRQKAARSLLPSVGARAEDGGCARDANPGHLLLVRPPKTPSLPAAAVFKDTLVLISCSGHRPFPLKWDLQLPRDTSVPVPLDLAWWTQECVVFS